MSSQMILSILLLIPSCTASPLVAIINSEPLDGNNAEVRAHFSVIAPLPCPSLLDSVCNGSSSSCITHPVSSPLKGVQPTPGWCVRQWQNIVPKQHSSIITLGSSVGVVLSTRVDLSVRQDTRKVNRPPFSALLPPIRVNADCPRDIPLSVYDLDRDKVRCRYAREDLRECHGNCSRHAFLLLEEASCTLRYKGGASVGQYYVKLMVEDFPTPTPYVLLEEKALSSNPVFLSITVENKSATCSAMPVLGEPSPDVTAISVLPYEEVNFDVTVLSKAGNVLEMAITGPPGLYISPLKDEGNFKNSLTLQWVRGPNQLSRLLSICYTANTASFQSKIRCIWIQQRPMSDLPTGTELNCDNDTMSLVLPISSMPDLPLDDLKLNDLSCTVFHNTTHVTASFPLSSCGTRRVHSGSELVYTNTIKSTGVQSVITRRPMMILPLACRIIGKQADSPRYRISMPQEEKVFGKVYFWVEFHRPGEGPLGNLTRNAKFQRYAREVRMAKVVNRLELLDMYVFSNSSMARAQLLIDGCMESDTEDFSEAHPVISNGCKRDNKTLEIIVQTPLVKVYRLDLSKISSTGDTMYVECKVSLCVTTQPSDKCPGPCDPPDPNVLVSTFLSNNYTVRSGPVSLLQRQETTQAPTTVPATTATTTPTSTTTTTTTTTTAPTTVITNTTTASASKKSSSVAVGVSIVVFHMFFLCLLH